MDYRKIAQYLNELDIKTARGNSWKNTQVFSVLKRYRQRQNREEVRETPSDIEFGKIELVWLKDARILKLKTNICSWKQFVHYLNV